MSSEDSKRVSADVLKENKRMLTRQDTPFSKGILIEELSSHFLPL